MNLAPGVELNHIRLQAMPPFGDAVSDPAIGTDPECCPLSDLLQRQAYPLG